MTKKFYKVSEAYTNYAEAIRDDNQMNVKKCPICGSIFETRKNEKFKVHFVGNKEGDYFFAPICNIVSIKFLEILKLNKITGYVEKDLDCSGWYDKNGIRLSKDISNYKEISITGRAGFLKKINGEEVPKCQDCNAIDYNCLDEINGLSVDLTWDGSDIFYFKNWEGVMIVTQQLKEILEGYKLKNIIFNELSQFQFE